MRRAVDVARRDLRQAAGSSLVLAVVAVLAGLIGLIVAVPGLLADFSDRLAFEATTQAVGTVVPIVALVTGYLAVAGERESGSIRVLLSLPLSRLEVVAGKFLSRAALVVGGIVLAFGFGALVSLLVYRSVPWRVAAWTTLLTCLLGVSFVGVAVGISAAVATRARAVALAVAFFVVTVVLWGPLTLGLQFLLELPFEAAAQPDWFLFLGDLPPASAFSRLYNSAVGSLLPTGPPPGDAVYLSDAAMVLVLALWTVVPLALGYWRFERVDL